LAEAGRDVGAGEFDDTFDKSGFIAGEPLGVGGFTNGTKPFIQKSADDSSNPELGKTV
jgi:hypothetical protein